ncbi:MAG: trigger factor [Eubacteriales bacterium]|nr:trigger factor [Eubacteriales bacterium]
MNHKSAALVITAALLLCFAAGCSDKPGENGSETNAGDQAQSPDDILSFDIYKDYNLDEYITLGPYKNLTVTKQDPTVTDEQYDAYINTVLSENTTSTEVTGRPVQIGDKLQIDYVGQMDGEETPDGMAADDQEIVIGSGAYIPGFEEGLIGADIGEAVTVSLNFPDPYLNNEALSGKPATFTITVDTIYEFNIPEMNDEFVKTISDFTTVDEYKSSVMLEIYSDNVQQIRTNQIGELWSTVIRGSVIQKYPEAEIQMYSDEMINYYREYALANGYETLEEMLGALYNTTLAEFTKESVTYAQDTVAEEMIMYLIVQNEDIHLTQAEYEADASDYAEYYGFESVTALEEYYTKDILIRSILWDKTLDYLLETAVEE